MRGLCAVLPHRQFVAVQVPTRQLEHVFHYVPKHASWLDMVEIEIGVPKQQCLSRRIADRNTPVWEIAAWEQRRSQAAAQIQWMFTTEKARAKLGRAYRPIEQARQEAERQAAGILRIPCDGLPATAAYSRLIFAVPPQDDHADQPDQPHCHG
jgi:hypothetical protein